MQEYESQGQTGWSDTLQHVQASDSLQRDIANSPVGGDPLATREAVTPCRHCFFANLTILHPLGPA